jgi:hypothetical protein
MASIKRPPSDPPGGRRKRPPTVINLEATEVPPESSTTPPATETPLASETTPAGETPAAPQQAAETPTPPPEKPAESRYERFAFEPPPPQDPEPPRAAEQPQPERRPPPPGFLGASASQMIAGASGAAGGFALFLLLWLFGAFSSTPPVPPRQPDLTPRFAAIEKQLNDLAARPAPAGVDPKAITGALDKSMEEIAARLASLERAVATPRAPVTDPVVLARITATENAAKSLADNVAALSRRIDGLDSALRETSARTEDRIGKLAAATTDLQARARETAAGHDRASRLAVASAALRTTVERGDAYLNELAIVKPLATDTAALAALEPYATTGIPSQTTLGLELAAIVRPMLRAAGEVPRDGGFLEKLQHNAEKLVRIRPADEARGDDRTAILARIEQRAAQGNVAGALSELSKLPAEVRAPAQAQLAAWTAKAEGRTKAIDAARRLATEAVAGLKVTP